MALPTLDEQPIGEAGIDSDRYRRTSGNLLGCSESSFERRRPDCHHRSGTEVAADATSLFEAVGRKAKPGHRPDNQLVGIVHFRVTDQMYQGSHDASLALVVPNTG